MKEIEKIPNEMRAASRGSFPLSPGVMTGHYIVGDLYWYYRQKLLKNRSIEEVFGTADPKPPEIVIPPGHFEISNPDGVNKNVWNYFLNTAFKTRPKVKPQQKIRLLIRNTASFDQRFYEERKKGQRSTITPDGPAPSLLRALVLEKRLPEYMQGNEFFDWLLLEMATETQRAFKENFQPQWSDSLKALVLLWNQESLQTPFFPE